MYAIALDIGTTNIGAALIALDKKKVLSSLYTPNEQALYGDNVISRLKFATANEGISELNEKLLSSVNSVIGELIAKTGIKKGDIETIVAVGNAAMHHLALKLPVGTLAVAPFSPHKTGLVRKKAPLVGLKQFPNAEFTFLPNIGGFVGSDAIAVALALDIHKQPGVRLAIDLGTNGEVILGNNKKILMASTAAGPAFEGWHVSCGLPASSVIKIVSEMIKEGYIDKTGRLACENDKKEPRLTQKDIREIQLAKSAIQTAINLLRKSYGVVYKEIEEVTITGRFGGSLKKEDLINIGIIPDELKGAKFKFIEGLALRGACVIIAEDRYEELDSILKITTHIELHKDRNFQERFAGALHFR